MKRLALLIVLLGGLLLPPLVHAATEVLHHREYIGLACNRAHAHPQFLTGRGKHMRLVEVTPRSFETIYRYKFKHHEAKLYDVIGGAGARNTGRGPVVVFWRCR